MKETLINNILNGIVPKFIYHNKVKVLVKKPYGKFETHYYDIDENNMIQVYDKKPNTIEGIKNPKIAGNPTYDKDGRLLCQWTEGEPIAFYLLEKVPADKLLKEIYTQMDEKGIQTLNTGIIVGMNRVKKPEKKGWLEDNMFYVLLAILAATVITGVMVYTGLEQLGVKFI